MVRKLNNEWYLLAGLEAMPTLRSCMGPSHIPPYLIATCYPPSLPSLPPLLPPPLSCSPQPTFFQDPSTPPP